MKNQNSIIFMMLVILLFVGDASAVQKQRDLNDCRTSLNLENRDSSIAAIDKLRAKLEETKRKRNEEREQQMETLVESPQTLTTQQIGVIKGDIRLALAEWVHINRDSISDPR